MPKSAGFTITELLVTIAVFAVLVPVFAGLVGMLDSMNDRARDMANIHALVENKVESLRSISFVGLSNGMTDFTSELPSTVGAPRSATYVVSSVNTALKQVDVTVTYSDRGNPRTLTYKTYIGELGVGQY